MPDRLFNILNFTGIAIGATQTLAHGLNVGGIGPLVPDLILLQFQGTFELVSATTVNVTIRNTANPTGDCEAWCEVLHPIERSFGAPPDDGSFKQHLVPQPYCPGTPNAGAGGSSLQVFQYTVTGVEPDLSELTITLPTAMLNTNYGVVATCQDVTNIASFDVNTKTLTNFVLSVTGDMTTGDVIAFFVAPLT